jgi:hypothetical protein
MAVVDVDSLLDVIKGDLLLKDDEVIGAIQCGEGFDFEAIDQLLGFEYRPETLSGVVYNTAEGATSILFRNGVIAAVDVSTKSEARVAIAETLERLREEGQTETGVEAVDNTTFEGSIPVPNEVLEDPPETSLKNLVETMETDSRLSRLYEVNAITEQEYDLLSRNTAPDKSDQQLTEYNTVPVTVEQDGFEITVLGLFPGTDISPLTFDDEKMVRTVVLWEVYNSTNSNARWGNRALSYALENKMKVNPDSGPIIHLENLEGPWERAPQSGTVPEIGADMKSRWISLVDVPDSQRISRAILEGYDHSEITIDIPSSAFGSSEDAPF